MNRQAKTCSIENSSIHQMVADTTSNAFNKEESRILKQINRCKTRKCAKLHKELTKKGRTFYKEQGKACPQKSSKAFYDCSVGFYETSKYKKLFDRFVKCGKKKCSKELKTLKRLRGVLL